MKTIKSDCDIAKLVVCANNLEYHIDSGYIDMAVTQSGGLPPAMMVFFGCAVREIARIRNLKAVNLMINKLSPGAEVPKHRDWIKSTELQKVPVIERWHLPIQTNENCSWWDEDNSYFHMPLGFWCGPVPYWKFHTVFNHGDCVRIHITVDLDTLLPIGNYI